MKFCFAEADFESFSLDEDSMFALPISISQDSVGEVTVTSYRVCEDISRELCSRFEGELFSEVATSEMRKRLTPLMERYSLYPTEETGDVLLELRADKANGYSGTAVILATNEEICRYPADTTLWRLEVDDEDPLDVVSAVIEDGRIVAFAAVNDIAEDGAAEINVECAVGARRRGYATESVRALTDYLLTSGADSVSYVCRERNVASVKTALKSGFKLTGKSINFVFYR